MIAFFTILSVKTEWQLFIYFSIKILSRGMFLNHVDNFFSKVSRCYVVDGY